MTTYHITARNNGDGEIYPYQIRQEGNRYYLVDLLHNEDYLISSDKASTIMSLIECNHEIVDMFTF